MPAIVKHNRSNDLEQSISNSSGISLKDNLY